MTTPDFIGYNLFCPVYFALTKADSFLFINTGLITLTLSTTASLLLSFLLEKGMGQWKYLGTRQII
jgi:hypothetical protein